MKKYTKDYIVNLIANNGYTPFQIKIIYNQYHFCDYINKPINFDNNHAIISLCDAWLDMTNCISEEEKQILLKQL